MDVSLTVDNDANVVSLPIKARDKSWRTAEYERFRLL